MKVTYHGHATVMVETGGKKILFDPFFTGNPKADVKAEDVRPDYILLTHGHGDHTADAVSIAKRTGATIVAVYELATLLGWRGARTHGVGLGGTYDMGGIKAKFTLAFHSSSLEDQEHRTLHYAGMPAGILLMAEGKTIYHAGDTALFSDMKVIGERHRPDLALLPIGDNFTMGPEDALLAAEWLKAKQVVPIHYNTFPLIAQDGDAFVAKLKERGIGGAALKPGESIEV
ncbi:conserved hypothetical protein [[Clostridium] ultunense Esp]|nr:conserved hypothetical protein [[Clostridium] ultunense Esp]